MKPRATLKSRVMSLAASEASPVRRTVQRRWALLWAGACLFMLLVFGGLGGMRAVERPVAFVVGTAAGWAAIAFVASLGVSRGRSMLGRPHGVMLFLAVTTPVALAAWYAAWVFRADVQIAVSPTLAVVPCVLATLGMALAPFALLLFGRRGSDPNHPRSTAAMIGVASGAWGAVLIDLHCERMDLVHVALGHVAPLVVLGLAGLFVGSAVLGVRADPQS